MKGVLTFGLIATLLVLSGCNAAKQATRSPETEALFRAAAAGNEDTVRSLVTTPNVDVNGVDEHGNTPLMEAARFGHDEVVTVLIIAKANVNARNEQGKTALTLAAEGGHDETVRVLTQAGGAAR
jgi:ankyrin repeat protein